MRHSGERRSPGVETCCPGALGDLMPREEAQRLADVLRALADPVRLRLLDHLSGAEGGIACACHLPEALGITQPTLSHHMRTLRDAGLVDRDRRGRWVHYTVRPEVLEPVRDFLDLDPEGPADRSC